ncbi:MAG: type II toxin-antitoxin system RelE/ParE family toxin [Acidobacteriota bacterium]
MNTPAPKPVIWMGDSLERLQEFPATVQDEIGYAIYLAQIGEKHVHAKPLRGLGPGVLEVVSDHRGDTFRAIYAVRFQDRVYVLHAFQKKSKKGIATPQPDFALLKHRLARAATLHATQEN